MSRRRKRTLPTPTPNQSQQLTPAVAPFEALPIVEKQPDRVVLRTAAVSIVTPYAVWAGRLVNPDQVLAQFGQGRGVAFYRLMMQQNLSLSADCSQWEDRINAIHRSIKPGDPGDSTSVEMARDCQQLFRRLQNANVINLKILAARWYGFAAIGKAGWIKESTTGLRAPMDLYDIDPWRIKFGPNGEDYLLTQHDTFNGIPLPARSVFYPRWGSLFTPYGQSDLRDIYLSCWYTQNVQQMLLASIEVLGRPIPWIEVSDDIQGDEFRQFEQGIASQYKYYVITRTPNARTQTTFPNLNVLANGSAGRSELEFIRYHAGLISRRILGTQQTQDKTGGSRALEDTRMQIAHDKMPPGSQFLDEAWTSGWLEDIGQVNWPNQPREIWPYFDSEADDAGKEKLTGPVIVAINAMADALRLKQITSTWATEVLVNVGMDRDAAESMVDSMTAPDADLDRSPTVVPPAKPGFLPEAQPANGEGQQQ